jgi:hypothetical protein
MGMKSERRYVYEIDAPGRPEHGTRFETGPNTPPMYAREPFTLGDGTLAHCNFVGVAAATRVPT